jgi:hypothetical protein
MNTDDEDWLLRRKALDGAPVRVSLAAARIMPLSAFICTHRRFHRLSFSILFFLPLKRSMPSLVRIIT